MEVFISVFFLVCEGIMLGTVSTFYDVSFSSNCYIVHCLVWNVHCTILIFYTDQCTQGYLFSTFYSFSIHTFIWKGFLFKKVLKFKS